MSDGLYRQEALDHLNRRLFGEVILRSPPAIWLITALLLALVIIGGIMLFTVHIGPDENSVRLLDWILGRSAA